MLNQWVFQQPLLIMYIVQIKPWTWIHSSVSLRKNIIFWPSFMRIQRFSALRRFSPSHNYWRNTFEVNLAGNEYFLCDWKINVWSNIIYDALLNWARLISLFFGSPTICRSTASNEQKTCIAEQHSVRFWRIWHTLVNIGILFECVVILLLLNVLI